MTHPTLMFGVGATKAGTSWLYDYLHDHPECVMPRIKEAHFFDSVFMGNVPAQVKQWQKREKEFGDLLAIAQIEGDERKQKDVSRRLYGFAKLIKAVREGEAGILTYLEFLHTDAQEAALVGDITPSYALLNEDVLSRMVDLAPVTKFVYLMRDPIERLWSHVRMVAKRSTMTDEGFAIRARDILRHTCDGSEYDDIRQRGQYSDVVKKLETVVPKEQLYIGFLETMITPRGTQKLCDFLGISYVPSDASKRVHEGKPLAMDDEMRGWAERFTAPQYAFVKETFGELPKGWHANMVRV